MSALSASRVLITLKEYPNYSHVISCSDSPNSFFLSFGVSILQRIIQLSKNPILQQPLKSSFEGLLSNSRQWIAHLKLDSELKTFEEIYNILTFQSQRKDALIWLLAYLDPQYFKITGSIMTIFKVFSYCFLYNKGIQLDFNSFEQLDQSFFADLIQEFANSLSVDVTIIWDQGSHETKSQQQGEDIGNIGLYIDSRGAYSLLQHRLEIELEGFDSSVALSSQFPFSRHQLFENNYYPETQKPNEEQLNYSQLSSSSQICPTSIANLLSVLCSEVVKNKLYSANVLKAAQEVLREFPNSHYIQGLKELSSIERPICVKHQNECLVQTICKQFHCKMCIFDKIIQEFKNHQDNHIFCDCNLRISPKEIDGLRKSEEFISYQQSI